MTSEPLRVADIMSQDIKTLGRNDKLSIAEDIMKQGRIRHMPVLDADGIVCGVRRPELWRRMGFFSRPDLRKTACFPAQVRRLQCSKPRYRYQEVVAAVFRQVLILTLHSCEYRRHH